jgi:hypothetical protein
LERAREVALRGALPTKQKNARRQAAAKKRVRCANGKFQGLEIIGGETCEFVIPALAESADCQTKMALHEVEPIV